MCATSSITQMGTCAGRMRADSKARRWCVLSSATARPMIVRQSPARVLSRWVAAGSLPLNTPQRAALACIHLNTPQRDTLACLRLNTPQRAALACRGQAPQPLLPCQQAGPANSCSSQQAGFARCCWLGQLQPAAEQQPAGAPVSGPLAAQHAHLHQHCVQLLRGPAPRSVARPCTAPSSLRRVGSSRQVRASARASAS
jgi:hypothetical protein